MTKTVNQTACSRDTMSYLDEIGNETTAHAHDSLHRLTQTTDPKGEVTKMTYDTSGNLLTTTGPAQQHLHVCLRFAQPQNEDDLSGRQL